MRVKSIIFYAVWLFVLTIFQPTLIQAISVFGISPNVYLVFIVMTAFLRGKKEGAICGAIFGLIFDLLIGRLVGLSGILFMYLAFAVGVAEERFLNNSEVIMVSVVVFITSLLYGIVYYIAYSMVWGDIGFITAVFRVVLLESIYTTIIGFILFLPIRKSFSLIEKRTMF